MTVARTARPRSGQVGNTNRRQLAVQPPTQLTPMDVTLPLNSSPPVTRQRQRPFSAPVGRSRDSTVVELARTTLQSGHRVGDLMQPPPTAPPPSTAPPPAAAAASRIVAAYSSAGPPPQPPKPTVPTQPHPPASAAPPTPAHRPPPQPMPPSAAPAAPNHRAPPSRSPRITPSTYGASYTAAPSGYAAESKAETVARVLNVLRTRTRGKAAVRPVFRAMDEDRRGGISHYEFVQAMRRWGMREPTEHLNWVAEAIDVRAAQHCHTSTLLSLSLTCLPLSLSPHTDRW